MDPVMHVLLPMLFLLAIRVDARKALLFSPLAILPDFDAAFHLHRAALHNFVVALVIPLGLIAYSRLRRPDWMLSALLVQFYLASHIVLDLGNVAFLWPFTKEMLYFDPQVTFNLQGGINFGFELQYGLRPYQEMTTTSFVSETGFAALFLGALLVAVFRKEAFQALAGLARTARGWLVRLLR